LIQERVGNTLELIGICKDFLNGTPAVQQLRDSKDKWDFINLKSFCSIKEVVFKLKRPPIEWEKIFASFTLIVFLQKKQSFFLSFEWSYFALS
jgi:hypothetical protein